MKESENGPKTGSRRSLGSLLSRMAFRTCRQASMNISLATFGGSAGMPTWTVLATPRHTKTCISTSCINGGRQGVKVRMPLREEIFLQGRFEVRWTKDRFHDNISLNNGPRRQWDTRIKEKSSITANLQ